MLHLVLEYHGKASGTNPEFAELTRRLGFEYNGMILHEYYFSNLRPAAEASPGARWGICTWRPHQIFKTAKASLREPIAELLASGEGIIPLASSRCILMEFDANSVPPMVDQPTLGLGRLREVEVEVRRQACRARGAREHDAQDVRVLVVVGE